VSHDLRTPLAAIRATAGALRPGSGLDDAARAASAAAIEREVQQLDRLVANLLDLGRIQAGALTADLDVFELDDLVGRATARLTTVDRLRPIDLEVPPLIVRVDPILLDTVLANLLDNAMKFAPPEAPIAISAVGTDGHVVRLIVEDGGPGVPDEMLDRIFEPFVRGRQAGGGRATGRGTGLGLAVVRGLVEVMGGATRARRSRLGGLAIEIELPSATVPAELSMVSA
jgi:two-component system sensor histidine kinase KdpD